MANLSREPKWHPFRPSNNSSCVFFFNPAFFIAFYFLFLRLLDQWYYYNAFAVSFITFSQPLQYLQRLLVARRMAR